MKATEIKPGHIELHCEVCGGPHHHTDEYGMRCEKECGKEHEIKAQKQLKKLMNSFLDLGKTNGT